MNIFSICWKKKQLRGVCFMNAPPNVRCVCVRGSKSWLCSSFRISFRVLSHKSSIAFLLTELLNMCRFKPVSLSLAMLRTKSPPPENLSTFISLYTAYTFLLRQNHLFIFSTGIFWKRILKPVMTKSFPFSLFITLSTFTGSIFPPAA